MMRVYGLEEYISHSHYLNLWAANKQRKNYQIQSSYRNVCIGTDLLLNRRLFLSEGVLQDKSNRLLEREREKRRLDSN